MKQYEETKDYILVRHTQDTILASYLNDISKYNIKSADNTRAKSLNVYMETYKPAYAIKLSAKNFGFENGKKIVPLYAAFCI